MSLCNKQLVGAAKWSTAKDVYGLAVIVKLPVKNLQEVTAPGPEIVHNFCKDIYSIQLLKGLNKC